MSSSDSTRRRRRMRTTRRSRRRRRRRRSPRRGRRPTMTYTRSRGARRTTTGRARALTTTLTTPPRTRSFWRWRRRNEPGRTPPKPPKPRRRRRPRLRTGSRRDTRRRASDGRDGATTMIATGRRVLFTAPHSMLRRYRPVFSSVVPRILSERDVLGYRLRRLEQLHHQVDGGQEERDLQVIVLRGVVVGEELHRIVRVHVDVLHLVVV